jgi:hypothetical protein
MTHRYITLPSGAAVTLGHYVCAWKILRAANQQQLHHGFFARGEQATAATILAAMRLGAQDRINRNIPGFGKGRKWTDEYQMQQLRDSFRLAAIQQRVRIYQFETPEFRRRFGHLLARHDD